MDGLKLFRNKGFSAVFLVPEQPEEKDQFKQFVNEKLNLAKKKKQFMYY